MGWGETFWWVMEEAYNTELRYLIIVDFALSSIKDWGVFSRAGALEPSRFCRVCLPLQGWNLRTYLWFTSGLPSTNILHPWISRQSAHASCPTIHPTWRFHRLLHWPAWSKSNQYSSSDTQHARVQCRKFNVSHPRTATFSLSAVWCRFKLASHVFITWYERYCCSGCGVTAYASVAEKCWGLCKVTWIWRQGTFVWLRTRGRNDFGRGVWRSRGFFAALSSGNDLDWPTI